MTICFKQYILAGRVNCAARFLHLDEMCKRSTRVCTFAQILNSIGKIHSVYKAKWERAKTLERCPSSWHFILRRPYGQRYGPPNSRCRLVQLIRRIFEILHHMHHFVVSNRAAHFIWNGIRQINDPMISDCLGARMMVLHGVVFHHPDVWRIRAGAIPGDFRSGRLRLFG